MLLLVLRLIITTTRFATPLTRSDHPFPISITLLSITTATNSPWTLLLLTYTLFSTSVHAIPHINNQITIQRVLDLLQTENVPIAFAAAQVLPADNFEDHRDYASQVELLITATVTHLHHTQTHPTSKYHSLRVLYPTTSPPTISLLSIFYQQYSAINLAAHTSLPPILHFTHAITVERQSSHHNFTENIPDLDIPVDTRMLAHNHTHHIITPHSHLMLPTFSLLPPFTQSRHIYEHSQRT